MRLALLALLSAFLAIPCSAQPPADQDGDGIADSLDNCSALANEEQIDDDADGFGNRCDADLDQTGLVTILDFGLWKTCYQAAQSGNPWDLACDFDGSRSINAQDLRILSRAFGRPPGPSGLISSKP